MLCSISNGSSRVYKNQDPYKVQSKLPHSKECPNFLDPKDRAVVSSSLGQEIDGSAIDLCTDGDTKMLERGGGDVENRNLAIRQFSITQQNALSVRRIGGAVVSTPFLQVCNQSACRGRSQRCFPGGAISGAKGELKIGRLSGLVTVENLV